MQQPVFVPTTRKELTQLGWDELDVLLLTGDAYVDHPSFGIPLLARLLIAKGFRTGIIAQPRWDTLEDVVRLGTPRLFVGIGSGCVDSMLAHYSAFRQKRKADAYSPGGRMGLRPNRATLVYTNLARRAFGRTPLVLGGIEASTRRLTHYDFWSDALRRPILFDAKADVLVWGMGERAIVACARHLAAGKALTGIPGTAWIAAMEDGEPAGLSDSLRARPPVVFPSHETCLADKKALLSLQIALEAQVHTLGAWGYELCGGRALVLAESAAPLTTEEMDALYALPFTRKAHPSYTEKIPAEEMLATSMTSHRGCGGGCSFCSLAIHQGRTISSRSETSLLAEAGTLVALHPKSRRAQGVAISDVGGPTANMWMATCAKRARDPNATCHRVSCCYPTICPHFSASQNKHVALLENIAAVPGVRSVRVASGVRADIALREPDALRTYIRSFTGGQLKLAPEHCVSHVLRAMRKPEHAVFERFLSYFTRESARAGKEQYIVPYLMSAFPGCTEADMRTLRDWLAARNWSPKQTQCFIPTPGTIATAMYYAEMDTAYHPIYVAKSDADRRRQHGLLCGGGSSREEADDGGTHRRRKDARMRSSKSRSAGTRKPNGANERIERVGAGKTDHTT